MTSTFICRRTASVAACLLACVSLAVAEPVNVRFAEGLVHGFLRLSALDGTTVLWCMLNDATHAEAVISKFSKQADKNLAAVVHALRIHHEPDALYLSGISIFEVDGKEHLLRRFEAKDGSDFAYKKIG